MRNYLIIKNFGPVKDAAIDLKPFLVLIGAQGTGKSTLAKVLNILNDYVWRINVLLDRPAVFDSFKTLGIYKYFEEDSYMEYCKDGLTICYSSHRFTLTHAEHADTDSLARYCTRTWVESLEQTNHNLNFFKEDTVQLSELVDKYAGILGIYSNSQLYIPAERNIIGVLSESLASMMIANIPLPKPLMYYLSNFEKAKKVYPTYEVPFLGIEYVSSEHVQGVKVSNGTTEKVLSLSECSSGIQTLVPMLMVVDFCIQQKLYRSFIVEELEQNLYPENQLAALRFLIKKLNQLDSRQGVVLTTHSPYLLSGINISLLAGRIATNEAYQDEVNQILPAHYQLQPDSVAAYALGEKDEYCKSIINKQTGTIEQNFLDTASSVTGEEFGKLYKLFIKSIRRN